ncbi:hypothetical protein HK102_001097 [Quaeritorhiza haematococci]|nr:hypothetical protein HK102_001097 [Quaeritorhiza haematococci]
MSEPLLQPPQTASNKDSISSKPGHAHPHPRPRPITHIPTRDEPVHDVISSLLTDYLLTTQQLFEALRHQIPSASTAVQTRSGSGQAGQGSADVQMETKKSPEEVMKKLVDLDDKLQDCVDELEEEQLFQQKLARVQSDIEEHNVAILKLVRWLQLAESKLETLLSGARDKMKSMKRAKEAAVDHSELIAYAHRISQYTSAPHNWKPNAPQEGIPVFPPIPQDMHMKRSMLFQPDLAKPVSRAQEIFEQPEIAMEIDLLTQPLQPVDTEHAPEEQEALLDLDL